MPRLPLPAPAATAQAEQLLRPPRAAEAAGGRLLGRAMGPGAAEGHDRQSSLVPERCADSGATQRRGLVG